MGCGYFRKKAPAYNASEYEKGEMEKKMSFYSYYRAGKKEGKMNPEMCYKSGKYCCTVKKECVAWTTPARLATASATECAQR